MEIREIPQPYYHLLALSSPSSGPDPVGERVRTLVRLRPTLSSPNGEGLRTTDTRLGVPTSLVHSSYRDRVGRFPRRVSTQTSVRRSTDSREYRVNRRLLD